MERCQASIGSTGKLDHRRGSWEEAVAHEKHIGGLSPSSLPHVLMVEIVISVGTSWYLMLPKETWKPLYSHHVRDYLGPTKILIK